MQLQIDTDSIKNINVLGELLRHLSFQNKFAEDGSVLTACYEHFDVQQKWKEISFKECSSVEKNILTGVLGLNEIENNNLLIYKNQDNNILMSYHWESDGILMYVLPDKKIIINYDCKKNHTWKINEDYLTENIGTLDLNKTEDLITIIKHANLEDAKIFSKILRATAHLLSLTNLQLAIKLKTSVPTIEKWKKNETSPHMLIKKSACNEIVSLAKEKIKKEKKSISSQRY